MSRFIVIGVVVVAAFAASLVLQVVQAATQDDSLKTGEQQTEVTQSAGERDTKRENDPQSTGQKVGEKESVKKSPEKPAGEKDLKQKSQKSKAKEIVITPEREAAALTFVQQHHPELTRLLEHLKTKSPGDYSRTVRDLFQISERLAKTRERDSQRYELELQAWQANSRCELLAARLQVKESSKLRDQLRQALSDREEAQIKLLEWERDRLAERLKSLEAAIESRSAAKQQFVEQRLKQFAKSAAERKKRETVKVPAEKAKNPTKQIPTQKNNADQ